MKPKQLAVIGKSLSHSFSTRYFQEKFSKESLVDYNYFPLEIDTISILPDLLKQYPELIGFNVTIPYKQEIISYLDYIDPSAQLIGAVNVVKVETHKKKKILKGFNTDYLGFLAILESFLPILDESPKALILGTGGASKSVQFALNLKGFRFQLVSRNKTNLTITYDELTEPFIEEFNLIINTTPVGMFPMIDQKPEIPYCGIKKGTIMIDLIYNPDQTLFLKEGIKQDVISENGLKMLQVQAEESWKIFQ
jgi:shikimate dehydrogenase